MTSRERVLTAFSHKQPDRVPIWCGLSQEFIDKAKRELGVDDEGLRIRLGDDFRRVSGRYAGPQFPLNPGCHFRTVFGVERAGLGYGHATSHPLANATLDEIHAYAWPDPAWIDVSQIRTQALAWDRQYAVLGGEWAPFWHDAIDLLGMENLYLLMYDQPELVDDVLGRIVDYYYTVSRRIFESASDVIDIFFIGNDFGGQTGPLLSPEHFQRFMFPHLKRLAGLGHQFGLKVQMHCCGGYAPLIPLMIEAGLDALHAVQPCCTGMNLPELKARYGQDIVFNGAIDSHHVLIEGTPELVREKTREVLQVMAPGGGYIAGPSHDTVLEETPVENLLAMADTVREWDGYRAK